MPWDTLSTDKPGADANSPWTPLRAARLFDAKCKMVDRPGSFTGGLVLPENQLMVLGRVAGRTAAGVPSVTVFLRF